MTNARLTIDEAQAFLDANPVVQWIDAFVFDMNGIPRGKRIRRSDLLGVAKSGLMMPTSVFIMDPLGNCVEETGRLWETGDPDHQCHLLSRTLVPIPVGDGRHAQAVMVVDVKDELDPRAVLVDQVERFTRAGQTPVAAVELEFYVTRRTTNGAFALHTPEGLSDDPGRPLTFGFEEMDTLSPFIDDIYRICEVQGLPVDAVMQEFGPGQFEINLKHRADAVAAALDGLLLKRAVKAAARAHQLDATFMAKPHHDWAGSGMHIHLSLLDKSGQNLFAGDPISPLFRHALGGMRETMADFMAVWAQSANAYRRYVPKAYVSMAAHWGFNNRTVALAHSPRQRRRDPHRASRRRRRRQSLPRDRVHSCRREPRYCQQDRSGAGRRGQLGDDRSAAPSDRLGQLPRSLPALGDRSRSFRRALPGCLFSPEACRAQQLRAHRHPARSSLVRASRMRLTHDGRRSRYADGDCR